MESLLCDEAVVSCTPRDYQPDYNLEVNAQVDRVLVDDDRVMRNMLIEEKSIEMIDYCGGFQTEIKPHMRKIVVDWMLEVCQDQQCQPQVFHLSLNYMDRFLSKKNISKNSFQAMAAGCLLLASKFSEVRPLTTEKLSLYTDNSASAAELREWEVRILNILQWELTGVTTQNFLEHFLAKSTKVPAQLTARVGRHAEMLATVAVTEYKFLLVQPSLLAAACLAAACQGLAQEDLLITILPSALRAQAGQISVLVAHLEVLLSNYSAHFRDSLPATAAVAAIPTSYNNNNNNSKYQKCREEGTTTPTDCHLAAELVGA
jgi:cyclin D2